VKEEDEEEVTKAVKVAEYLGQQRLIDSDDPDDCPRYFVTI
jgi:hypothetical protein